MVGSTIKYRKFGSLPYEVSALGLGTNRLPTVVINRQRMIDSAEAIRLIRHGIDAGINYIDTGFGYHSGMSELIIGEALKNGYREKVKIATKMPLWHVNEPADMQRFLSKQLEKLQTDHIDIYMLHSLNNSSFKKMQGFDVFEFLEAKLSEGVIGAVGFSFHDDLSALKTIVDSYDFKVCQLQLNIIDQDRQATLEGMRYAYEKGNAIVIMEPLRGGRLANVPPEVANEYASYPKQRSPVEWAFRFMFNFPEVSTILSGMNTFEQVDENVDIFSNSKPNVMTKEELKIIDKVKTVFDKYSKVHCTGCDYCMPCPSGVYIPMIFWAYNEVGMFADSFNEICKQYVINAEKFGAQLCTECGRCERLCPQSVAIIEKLKEAHAALS